MNDEIKLIIGKFEKNINVKLTKQDEMMQQLINLIGKNNERFNEMDNRFNDIDGRFNQMNSRFDGMDQRLERIEEAMIRLEENEPSNIMSLLQQIDGKMDERDHEIQALNKRVFKTESEIERLTRQSN